MDAAELTRLARRMSDTLAHRGPNDSGTWVDETAGIALGFRRLSILDLSPTGHQPMLSASGRFVMIFNGEIYNYRELRRGLEAQGCSFRGHSDTEVLLAALERWGIQAAISRVAGMFAIAVWDRETRRLTLIRDRLGIKPLFVYAKDGVVAFASELKALIAGPQFDRALNMSAVADYLRYLYVPWPRTIFQHVWKLGPGHVLTIGDPSGPLPESVPFWSAIDAAHRGLANPVTAPVPDVLEELEHHLRDTVTSHLQSDVPLGALLSGGIDSSCVVSLMQASTTQRVKTFSVAFDRAEYNEAHHARTIARHLGTDHTEFLCTGDDALAVVPRLPELFDEPHADTSQIPAYLICALAGKSVTVALSGDGGDEVFAGYNRYTVGERMLRTSARLPVPARRALATCIEHLSPVPRRTSTVMSSVLSPITRASRMTVRLQKIGSVMTHESVPAMYRSLVSAWQDPGTLVIGGAPTIGMLEDVLESGSPARLIDRMMLADQITYMVDDQLAKVDRVSMAASIEVRVPFVDHRLVEYAWRVPAALKTRNGQSKWPVRQILQRYLPTHIFERPKMGFSVPIDEWLRGPLRQWAEELIAPERLKREGLLNAAPIHGAWQSLLGGERRGALGLWAVLMLQAWRERWLS